MTSLLLWKLAAPLVIVSSVYFGLTRLLRVPRPAVFLLVVGLAGMRERARESDVFLYWYFNFFFCFLEKKRLVISLKKCIGMEQILSKKTIFL